MLLPSKLKGLLWWHQFDGLDMSVTSWTTPLQLSVFISEWNAYFTTSNQFSVEKQATPSIFPILSEVRHNTEVKTVANFQFTRTLKLNRNIKTTEMFK